MRDADDGKRIHNLKRRRARERGNITRFVMELGKFTDTTTLEDYEYYKDGLHDTLGRLTSLDDEMQEFLDSECDADLHKCEGYIESAKRASYGLHAKFKGIWQRRQRLSQSLAPARQQQR
jgi:hypothetical protein